MRRRIGFGGASIVSAVLLMVSPAFAWAEGTIPLDNQPAELAPVVITEVQTGSVASRADEFIELHNTTNQSIDLSGWQIRYVTASSTSTASVASPTQKIVISADSEAMIPAKGYYALHAGAVVLPDGVIGAVYQPTLPAAGGSVVLLSPDAETCKLIPEDALAWGEGRLFGEGKGAIGGISSSKDRLIQRYIDATDAYVETSDNSHDFVSLNMASPTTAIPSPGSANVTLLPQTPATETGSASLPLPDAIPNSLCTLPPDPEPIVDPPLPSPESPPSVQVLSEQTPANKPKIPAGNAGLKSPQLSELLPNPAAPQTDAKDEFIELYNPNNKPFELSGYVLEVGTTTKRRYTFPAQTFLQPKSFKAFFSADTNLALSNTSSQVRLIDPLGVVLMQSEAYQSAKDDQSWLLANGLWQWSTKPTPNAINMVTPPAVKTKQATSSAQKAASTKAAGTSKTSSDTDDKDQQVLAATTTPRNPLHPGVLALIGGFAVLYGAYEYRRDVANKFYQFRRDRAARHAARQGAAGRGSD